MRGYLAAAKAVVQLRSRRVRNPRIDWFNKKRLLEPIGTIPPDEAEARYYAQFEGCAPNPSILAATRALTSARRARGQARHHHVCEAEEL